MSTQTPHAELPPALGPQSSVEMPSVADSYTACREVAHRCAGNFFHGMKLMPRDKRASMYAIYAWMRVADDLADESGQKTEKQQRLEAFRRQTHAVLHGKGPVAPAVAEHAPFWPAICDTLRRHQVNVRDLDDMIDGQLHDQTTRRYATFEQLHDYCRKVASTVGLVCLSVWGYEGGEATRRLAEQRGIALQLTNILRDLVEDAQRDRLYLPAEDLARFELDSDELMHLLKQRQRDGRLERLMRFEACRAAAYYDASLPLEARLAADARATCWAMMRIYRGLLEKIAADPLSVLARRVRLSRPAKLGLGLAALWRFRGGRSPRATPPAKGATP